MTPVRRPTPPAASGTVPLRRKRPPAPCLWARWVRTISTPCSALAATARCGIWPRMRSPSRSSKRPLPPASPGPGVPRAGRAAPRQGARQVSIGEGQEGRGFFQHRRRGGATGPCRAAFGGRHAQGPRRQWFQEGGLGTFRADGWRADHRAKPGIVGAGRARPAQAVGGDGRRGSAPFGVVEVHQNSSKIGLWRLMNKR